MKDIFGYIDAHQDEAVELLKALCRQPSVSAEGQGLHEMADVVVDIMTELGVDTQLEETSTGVPAVVGVLENSSKSPTLLFYNHYDVQPVDPLDEWVSPPFEPTVRDGHLYARGATDNKGNIATRLFAAKAFLAVHGRVPCNIKFLVEGQEEVGSPGLPDLVERRKELLRSDACVWEDAGGRLGKPIASLGTKGMSAVELVCRVSNIDAHSSWAGVFPNAIWRLTWALSAIKDIDERVQIPGFYEKVRPLSEREQGLVDDFPPADADELRRARAIENLVLDVTGEKVFARQCLEPTCNVSGITGGYTSGAKKKTVIPAEARARIDMRLVPEQDPDEIFESLTSYLNDRGFADIEVKKLQSSYPSRTSPENSLIEAIKVASIAVYDETPVIAPNIGGSTPMWVVDRLLGIPCSGTGINDVTALTHAPNENVKIENLISGTKYMAAIMAEFGVRSL